MYTEGQKVIIIERTYLVVETKGKKEQVLDKVYEWEGTITKIDPAFIETKHRRKYPTNPD